MPFKKTSKRIIKWMALLLFAGAFILGYFLYNQRPSDKHLNLIPNSANGILIINPYEIFKEIKELIKRKPSLLLKFDIDQLFSGDLNPGINPINKIGIFQDSIAENSIFGAVVSLSDEQDFLSFVLKKEIQPILVDQSKVFLDKNIATIVHQDAAIVIYSQKASLNQDLLVNYLHSSILASKNDTLSISSSSHFTFWNKNINHPLVNFCSVKSHTSSVNLSDSGFNFKSCVELNDTLVFNSLKLKPIELANSEIGKLSFSLSKDKAAELLSFLPFKLDSAKKYFNGKMWISAIGYREKNILFRDSIVLNENFSVPELAIGIEISDSLGIRNALLSDSSFNQKENDIEITSNDFQKEKFHLIILKNQVVLSTRPIKAADLSLDFHTLSMKVDMEKAINSYTIKKIYQQFMINSVKKFNPHKMDFYSYAKKDNQLLIKGTINFGDDSEHVFETLLPAFELLSNNFKL